jgi:hypothetical protein
MNCDVKFVNSWRENYEVGGLEIVRNPGTVSMQTSPAK